MKNRLIALRESLSASYWFIPTLMAVMAAVLSIVTIKLDEGVGRELAWVSGLIYVDSPEGARAVLSTVASSMINVAGVVFSLTMVVLSLTSQQYGPLVLNQFMRDRGNQFVLGVFTSTFIYCLLILRTIRGVEDSVFIPHISVLAGLGLSITSLAVLIYFIHHVSQSIQAPRIIVRISEDLIDAIDDLFPTQFGKEAHPPDEEKAHHAIREHLEQHAYAVKAEESGYLQMIDETALFEVACKNHLIVQLEAHPGEFFFKEQILARVLPLREGSEELSDDIRDVFIFGSHRTNTQDIEFIFTQLRSIAVRSLSPGINDPFTATMVIDRLGEAFYILLQRDFPSMYRYDEKMTLRVIATPVTFETLFHTAFDAIRHYGHADLSVAVRLLQVMNAFYEKEGESPYYSFIQEYADQVYRECSEHLTSSEDQRRFDQVYAKLKQDIQSHQEK